MKKSNAVFQKRLAKHHDELRWLYMELYGNESMFAELTSQMYEYYQARKISLKNRDEKREAHPDLVNKKEKKGFMI